MTLGSILINGGNAGVSCFLSIWQTGLHEAGCSSVEKICPAEWQLGGRNSIWSSAFSDYVLNHPRLSPAHSVDNEANRLCCHTGQEQWQFCLRARCVRTTVKGNDRRCFDGVFMPAKAQNTFFFFFFLHQYAKIPTPGLTSIHPCIYTPLAEFLLISKIEPP